MCLLPLTGPLLSRVWGEATDCAQAVLEKEEMQVKILSKSFQDSVNRPPPPKTHFLAPLMLNLRLELLSWEKRGQSL